MGNNNAFAGISFGYDSNDVFDYKQKETCSKWNTCYKEFEPFSLAIHNNNNGNFMINGTFKELMSKVSQKHDLYLKYWGANSPNYSTSYAGSALPFANEEIAFDDTNNYGVVKANGDTFSFMINYPNSYYKNLGKVYVPPQIKVRIISEDGKKLSEIYKINLGNGVPFRSLTWPQKRDWNKGPLFYCNNNLPVRTQEQILRDSSYPCINKEPANFWGLVPPH